MGRLPMLTMTPRGDSKQIGSFGGLNKGLVIGENEFSDMKNMSSDVFPAIAVRKPRGEILKSLSKPHGIIYKMVWPMWMGQSCITKIKKLQQSRIQISSW